MIGRLGQQVFASLKKLILGVGCALFLHGAVWANTDVNTDAPSYRIGPEDVLQITVWKEEGLDKEALVQPDGRVSFPLAGSIVVAGKTPAQVESEIRSRIQKYIPEAVVNVSVTKVSGYAIFVIGQVKSPGQFTLGRYVDVMQALTLAGGLTPYASESNIRILRRDSESQRETVYKFNFAKVKKGRNLNSNLILHSGDVVVVP